MTTPLRLSTCSLALALFAWASLPTPASAADPFTATARAPLHQAKDVCPDTLLALSFDVPPAIGAAGQVRIYDAADDKLVDTLDVAIPLNNQAYTIGSVEFHAYPILVNGNTATVHPHNNRLAYGKSYYVQIDPGVLTHNDAAFPGIAGRDWLFSTKVAPPPAGTNPLVIAADGTADFATLQGAIDFVPPKNEKPDTLFLRKGVYREIVSIVDKSKLTILGEDRKDTILTYPNNEKVQLGANSSSKRGVMNGLRSTGIAVANLTVRNATPKGTGGAWQAEAILFKNNSQVIITDVDLYSFQDTLQISSAACLSNCHIEGDVDFMWGTGPCFFKDCSFVMLTSNDAFVVSRNNAATHGFVYVNCAFDAAPGVTGAFLANNQNYPNSEVVLLDCTLTPRLNPAAWRGTGAAVHYWEFNSTTIPDGKPADVSGRAAVSRRLTLETDAQTIADYRNPAFVLANWTPALAPLLTRQPQARTVAAGDEVTLTVGAVGVPAPTFQWSKNGTILPGANGPSLKIPKMSPADAGSYTALIQNPHATVTSAPAEAAVH